jgi:hypothetical protein
MEFSLVLVLVHCKATDVTERHVASMSRIEECATQESRLDQVVRRDDRRESCSAYSSKIKMEATRFSETAVGFRRLHGCVCQKVERTLQANRQELFLQAFKQLLVCGDGRA